jgi:hypothetical protein
VIAPSDIHLRDDAVALGEVVETDSAGYWAESEQLHQQPELGAIVRVGGLHGATSYYGVVTFGQTAGLDTSRKAVRRGGDGVSDQAIYARHPELEYVLRTLFNVASIGYVEGGRNWHALPPLPVPMHYTVHACSPAEVRAFCADPRYFPALLAYSGPIAPEQLLVAHLRWTDAVMRDGHVWLADATRRLARLMKRDYDRLAVILSAIDPS